MILSTCLGVAALAGCATSTRERDEALAERYAREETRQIDEKAFAQARERSRVQRDARRRLGTERVDAAAPLDIDPDVRDRWQFGTLPHPLRGTPVCAAVAGAGLSDTAPPFAAPRLVVLADGGFVTSETALVTDRTESAVRIDGGLPIPLELARDDGRVARLAIAPERLLARLRDAAVATLGVGLGPRRDAVSAPDTARTVEQVVELDGLQPMLDELVRCERNGATDSAPPRRPG